MRQAGEKDGVYTLTAAASLLGAARRELPDAVPPLAPAATVSAAVPGAVPAPALAPESAPVYGWITGACAAPNKGDHYIVKFLGKREFIILAYVDRFGRVFAQNFASVSPPAREPDLSFAFFADQDTPSVERGCVQVRTPEGDTREVARYTCAHGRYTLEDSWYDFGPYGVDLSYDDAMARAFLAFVYRPKMAGGAEIPTRGLEFVHERLSADWLLPGLRAIIDDVRYAENDPVVHAPALARSLARWLSDAGLDELKAPTVPDDALRLVRTVRYANTYYVARESEGANVSRRTVWALESALNRFLLMEEAFGDRASLATDIDCARWEAYLLESAGTQPLPDASILGAPAGAEGGEWEVRCHLGAVLERLRLPVRVEAQMRANVAEGVAAFDMTVPDAALMPAWRWVDVPQQGWAPVGEAERDAQARRYAARVGLLLASAAFEASPQIQRVDVAARPLGAAAARAGSGAADDRKIDVKRGREFPEDAHEPAFFLVTLTRAAYEASGQFRAAPQGDPLALLAQCGAVWDLPAADPFALINALPATALRRELPEAQDATLPPEAQKALGATRAADVRIVADAYRRRIGEGLADRIACAASATEAIRVVREEQDAAEKRGDDLTMSACTRLMAALAEGSLDTEDQNAVVVCFLGEDRCLTALGRARTLAQRDPQEAVAVLMDAVAEAAALDGYVDGATTVFRSFDSYASRVLYNQALRAAGGEEAAQTQAQTQASARPADSSTSAVPTLAERARADAGRRVQLVPDSFYLCHLEIVSLLERSFERVDDALRYGRRAIELAPATAAGYRQLGRAYMLVGDMDNASAVLKECLRVATQVNDVSVAYYQLAYALWKAGEPRTGAACYLKSVMTAPVVALQAMAELKELVAETSIEALEREEVDGILREANIPLSPTDEVLDTLDAAAAAATDAGLFSVARNLLAQRLNHRSDDALVNVLRSLEVSSA